MWQLKNSHTGRDPIKMHLDASDAEPIQKREENFLITFQALLSVHGTSLMSRLELKSLWLFCRRQPLIGAVKVLKIVKFEFLDFLNWFLTKGW